MELVNFKGVLLGFYLAVKKNQQTNKKNKN